MLIKSQDRKALVDINGMTIKVKKINCKIRLIAYGNNQSADEIETLGIYGSEERAINILDDISKNYANYTRKYGCDCTEYAVFDMPED